MKILKTQYNQGWTFHEFYLGHYAKALRIANHIASLPDNSGDQLAKWWYDATDFLRIVKSNAVGAADKWDYREYLALRKVLNSISLLEKN